MRFYIAGLLAAILMAAEPNLTQAQVFGKRAGELQGQHHPGNLAKDAQYSWFTDGMQAYKTNPATIAELKQAWSLDLEVIVFAGSWCPDTHREMPAFFRTLKDAGVPDEKVELYFLDRRKRSGTGVETTYQITSVPTFVVLKNGAEIGRINAGSEEPPEESLLHILQQ